MCLTQFIAPGGSSLRKDEAGGTRLRILSAAADPTPAFDAGVEQGMPGDPGLEQMNDVGDREQFDAAALVTSLPALTREGR